jgi:hypothetical protein
MSAFSALCTGEGSSIKQGHTCVSGGKSSAPRQSGDTPIAREKSPFDAGDTIWAQTDVAPALCPESVTRRLSPPNVAMLRCTHSNPARWS